MEALAEEELIRLGAYRPGSSAALDEAIPAVRPRENSWPEIRKAQPALSKDINALSKFWVEWKPKTNTVPPH